MRNLKKFLALVLAMMMAFSLMITANASYTADSDFSDAESLTPEFREAVSVLEGLEVFEGYEDGTFKPKNNITRAEVATIVYRLATGDVKGTQANLYKDYATFSDVKADHWAAGYINYCANAEWISGYGNGKFGPNDQVTGYQAASMILRAVGYGKNKEFVGSGWQVQTANFSRTLGLLDNVNDTTYANTLNQAAPRELVAEILFQAGLIQTVVWTPLNGYQPGNPVQGAVNDYRGLAWRNFKLNVGNWTEIDKWGRPGYYWFKDTKLDATPVVGTNVVATIALEPDLEFDTAWKECDVAHELDISTYDDFNLFVNRKTAITNTNNMYRIEATDTVTNVGGQGRITEFYTAKTHPWNELYSRTNWKLENRVVMVDTYLATVTNVTERVLDPAGHVIVPAYLYLDVYEGHNVGASVSSGGATHNTSKHRVSKSTANWEYVKGDKVLVQGYTNYTDGVKNHSGSIDAINKAAFETNMLRNPGTNYANDESTALTANYTNINVLQKADFKTGKQTVTYWNKGMHTVDGGDLNDAMTLFLDVAGTNTNTTYAWYFDQMGNLIGIDNIPDTINYGVITSIYSAFDQGDSVTSGTAKAIANVLYANGSTGTVTIDKFLMSGAVGTGHGPANTAMKVNTAAAGTPSNAANSLELVPVYDNTQNAALTASNRGGTIPNTVQANGWLHVAPVIAVNAVENGYNGINGTNPYFGVLRGNLFKFVASTDGNMTAIEVAGAWDTLAPANENNGVYTGHYNGTATVGTDKILKNSGYMTLTTPGTSVWLDDNVAIMVRASATSSSVATYTLDTLPGDVTLTGAEVDWVDVNDDNRADYVYVTGDTAGTLTYGLFYYNGGAAQWNGVDKNGTLTGWLNGEPATVTFSSETVFNAVRNSQAYLGHLFALELTNGVVTGVLYGTDNDVRLLQTHNTSLKITNGLNDLQYSKAGTPVNFKAGTLGGNPYVDDGNAALTNLDTNAIYLRDDSTNLVAYDPATRTVTLGNPASATYYLTTTSKVIGLGMGVNTDGAILDYLNKSTTNDVTIVYTGTGTSRSIVEIYVATDPNVTPPTTGDTSTLTLAVTNVGGDPITLTPTFKNNSTEALTNVTFTVSYRLAGTNNEWIDFADEVTNANPLSLAIGATQAGTGRTVSGAGVGAYYEAKVVVTATGVTTGATYSYTSTTHTFYV